MRDRLIELINRARDIRTGQELAERIADHLLANGVIVKPICSECVYYDGFYWHQCESCLGDKPNRFTPKLERSVSSNED